MDCANECPAYPVCYSQRMGDKCQQVLNKLFELLSDEQRSQKIKTIIAP